MILMFLCGCFDAPLPRVPEVLTVGVPGAPTDGVSVRLSAPIDADSSDAVVLVRGEAESALVAALARPPLPARFLPQLVPVRTEVDGDALLMMPRRALLPEARYTVVVGAGLRAAGVPLGRPLVQAFITGSLADAAPVLSLVDPLDGAAGVIRNLRALTVAWSKPMPAARFQVTRDDGVTWPSHTNGLRVVLDRMLDGDRQWTLGAEVEDAEGRAPYGDPPLFSTGSELRTRPVLDGLALEVADRCLVARFATEYATSARLCAGDRCRDDAFTTLHAVGAPLAELQEGWTLRVWDESTAPAAFRQGTVSLPPLPLVLTEVLTEPRGPRLAQQWAEFLNLGDGPVEVGGLQLCTASGCDNLPQGTLASGAWAVVVGADFADDGVDVQPAAGTLVLRLANQRLGGRGIRSGGEPLWLQAADGTLITRWGGWPASLSAGQSLSRQPYNCDLPASFRPGPPTPGAPS